MTTHFTPGLGSANNRRTVIFNGAEHQHTQGRDDRDTHEPGNLRACAGLLRNHGPGTRCADDETLGQRHGD